MLFTDKGMWYNLADKQRTNCLLYTSGIGIGDVLDAVIHALPEKEKNEYDGMTKFCVIGRPNVGKSSLVNSILNQERVIVSNIEGTTRDAIDTPFKREGKEYVVIDTAGIRKRGKVYENIEKYSVLRAMSAIERSDVVLVVIDGEKGIRDQDKHVAGYAHEAGKGVVIVYNKWDAVEKDEQTMHTLSLIHIFQNVAKKTTSGHVINVKIQNVCKFRNIAHVVTRKLYIRRKNKKGRLRSFLFGD